MVNPNRFYTYAYLREDRTPYYIGKGRGRRIHQKGKGEVNPPKDKSRIIFLKQNLTEEEAFKHEIYMIAVFGRKDLGTGILRNKTDGGEGSSGTVVSEETRRKCSEATKGKKWWNDGCGNHTRLVECPGENWVLGVSEEQKTKIGTSIKGKNNPSYRKKWWNDGCGNHLRSAECPGENWVLGLSEEYKKKLKKASENKNVGLKWWNDCCGNTIRSKECPGENWVSGLSEEYKRKIGKANTSTGTKWWNDGYGNAVRSKECPGTNWVLGRGNYKKVS